MENSQSASFMEKYMTPIALVLGAIIVALAIMFGRGGEAPTPAGTPTAVDIKDVQTESAPFIGSENAPVTIAVWYDFQCRFCKQFETTTLKEVEEAYVKSGQVRIVYKDFQFLGPASTETALYSRAVWDLSPQNWGAWFKTVMAGEGENTLSKEGLDAVSTSLGLDTARIASLIEENKATYSASLASDKAEGQSFGITGTPGSIIGTSIVGGAQPFSAVQPLIEAELN